MFTERWGMDVNGLKSDVEAVLKRHGSLLPDEQVEAEAEELLSVFAKCGDDLVALAHEDDEELLDVLAGVARDAHQASRDARRASRLQMVLTVWIALYVLAWTILASTTHRL